MIFSQSTSLIFFHNYLQPAGSNAIAACLIVTTTNVHIQETLKLRY